MKTNIEFHKWAISKWNVWIIVVGLLLFAVSSCSKENEGILSQVQIKYNAGPSGDYDMYYNSKMEKGLSDSDVILQVKTSLKEGNFFSRSGEGMKLNEVIFTLEGLLNLEKSDGRSTGMKGVDYYTSELDIMEISNDGEVWIDQVEFERVLVDLETRIVKGENDEIKIIDLNVVQISGNTVEIKVSSVKGEPYLPGSQFAWFHNGENYPAMGPEALSGQSFSNPTCYSTSQDYMTSCVVNYPSTLPYPAWIRINEKLNVYYNLFFLNGAQTNTPYYMLNVNKVWFTNVLNPSENGFGTSLHGGSIYSSQISCSRGRLDYIYMAGNYNSSIGGVPSGVSGCGCSNATVPVTAPGICGEFVFVHSQQADENLDYLKMNKYLAKCIEHIDIKFNQYSQLGLVNAVAAIQYTGHTITDPTYFGTGINGPGDIRTHYCTYYLGNANYY